MTLPTNGTVKKIIVGVVTTLLLGLVTQVLVSANRLTALEAKMESMKESITINRTENRDEHKVILEKLDRIQLEVVKKR